MQSHGLPLARRTLQKYATTGGAPRFHKFDRRCVYRRVDLEAWMESKLGRPVTSSSNAEAIPDGVYPKEATELQPGTCKPAQVPDSNR